LAQTLEQPPLEQMTIKTFNLPLPVFRFSTVLTMTLVLVACSNPLRDWTLRQQNDKVVWASDDSDVAISMLSYEEKSGGLFSGTTDKRNFKHQLVIQKLEGAGRHVIGTDWLDYQSGAIFYMKPAGYLVVQILLDNDRRRFDKVALDGSWVTIVEERQPYQPCTSSAKTPPRQVEHQVIPSPDGQQLIEVYSPECGKVTVEFLYANNLSFIDSQTFNIDEPMTAMWHPEGDVILVSNDQDNAWKFAAQSPPIPIPPPRCLSPVTTSSDISSEGKLVYFEGDKLAAKPMGSNKAFGCQ
jgi:hypothetical protein